MARSGQHTWSRRGEMFEERISLCFLLAPSRTSNLPGRLLFTSGCCRRAIVQRENTEMKLAFLTHFLVSTVRTLAISWQQRLWSPPPPALQRHTQLCTSVGSWWSYMVFPQQWHLCFSLCVLTLSWAHHHWQHSHWYTLIITGPLLVCDSGNK